MCGDADDLAENSGSDHYEDWGEKGEVGAEDRREIGGAGEKGGYTCGAKRAHDNRWTNKRWTNNRRDMTRDGQTRSLATWSDKQEALLHGARQQNSPRRATPHHRQPLARGHRATH